MLEPEPHARTRGPSWAGDRFYRHFLPPFVPPSRFKIGDLACNVKKLMMGRKWGGIVPSERKLDVAEIDSLVIAGWTGRNVEALEAHIKELEAIGVKRPKSVPIFYRVAYSLLTTASAIEVMADKSSGEVEFVLYALNDGLWLGVGSDHTDRKAETVGVTLSKQLCAKPVGATLWRYDEVKPHWDKLKLRSTVPDGGKRRLYQEGPVTKHAVARGADQALHRRR